MVNWMSKYTLEESVDKITNEPYYNISDENGNTAYGLNYSQAFVILQWLQADPKSDSQNLEKIFTFGIIILIVILVLLLSFIIYGLM